MKKEQFLTILTDVFSKFDKTLILGPNDETVQDILNQIEKEKVVDNKPTLSKETVEYITLQVNLMRCYDIILELIDDNIPEGFEYNHGSWFNTDNRWFIYIGGEEDYWCELSITSKIDREQRIIFDNKKKVYEQCLENLEKHKKLENGSFQMYILNTFEEKDDTITVNVSLHNIMQAEFEAINRKIDGPVIYGNLQFIGTRCFMHISSSSLNRTYYWKELILHNLSPKAQYFMKIRREEFLRRVAEQLSSRGLFTSGAYSVTISSKFIR